MKAYIWAPALSEVSYGPSHPFRPMRMALTHHLIGAYGLLGGSGVRVVEPAPAREEDLLAWHERDYVRALRRAESGASPADDYAYGLGSGDNPVFPGLWSYVLQYTGATLAAANLVAGGEASAAFNMAGGLHHAHAGRASGFCYANDIVLGILRLLETFDRVFYVDVDAHHGDGVQEAFWRSDRVLTFSLHESGRYLFPGTGFDNEIGEGQGRGFSVNVPLPPGTGDDLYLECFRLVAGEALERFRPQAVVAQFGADSLLDDPLAHLGLGNLVHREAARLLLAAGIPLVALGGGGYDLDNVARAWTLVWAAIAGAEPPDELPESYLRRREAGTGAPTVLRDPPRMSRGAGVRAEVKRVMDHLERNVLPLIHSRGARGKGA